MSGPSMFGTPRGPRRGAALTLIFGVVLATGAAAGTWGATGHAGHPGHPGRGAPRSGTVYAGAIAGGDADAADGGDTGDAGDTVADTDQIAQAIDEGKMGPQTAQELVSRSGDRWSSFYTAQEYAGFQQAMDGHYVGVGLWVRRTAGGLIQVARVQKGSPARAAGIAVGDRLRSIDGTRTDGRAVTDVVARLRGDNRADTPVRLALERGDRAWAVTLRRAVLATEAVTVRHLGHGVTYVKIDAFTQGVGRQVADAVRGTGTRTRGVLLDLRGNSGGLVTEAVAVASAFLHGGLVATYDVHGQQRALYAADGGDSGTPLVVLVDGGTMSAAELLAGALQDRGRAVIVGSRTFGKGSVQMPSTLPDGSVAELTVGHYNLPAGRSVDGHGIEPDLAVNGGADPQVRAREVLGGLGTAS